MKLEHDELDNGNFDRDGSYDLGDICEDNNDVINAKVAVLAGCITVILMVVIGVLGAIAYHFMAGA